MNKFPNLKFKSLKLFADKYKEAHYNVLEQVNINNITKVCKIIEKNYKDKNSKILICGNGGSAALSDHFACDHQKILSSTKKYKPVIISLCSNNSLLTAISNDISYENVFAEQIKQFTNKNSADLLLVITSSGKSKNIINAIKTAKKLNIKTISLTGFDGGVVRKLTDLNIHVDSFNYGIVECIHHSIMNIISQFLRQKVLSKKKIKKINF